MLHQVGTSRHFHKKKLCEGSLLFLLAWGVAGEGGGQFLLSSSQQSTREGKMGGKIIILNKELLTFELNKFQIIEPNTRKVDIRL